MTENFTRLTFVLGNTPLDVLINSPFFLLSFILQFYIFSRFACGKLLFRHTIVLFQRSISFIKFSSRLNLGIPPKCHHG